MDPAEAQPMTQTGSPVTAKLLVAVRLKALVTVAVMAGEVPSLTQEGAVQVMLLVEALLAGVPSEPVLAAQEKVSAEPSGSLATTSKVSTWAAEAVSEEAAAEVMRGLKCWWVGGLLTHNTTAPVVCPPRPSETETVRRQLLQELAGSAEGVNWAELEEALAQEPEQEALQE
jgi:hypothetical protein